MRRAFFTGLTLFCGFVVVNSIAGLLQAVDEEAIDTIHGVNVRVIVFLTVIAVLAPAGLWALYAAVRAPANTSHLRAFVGGLAGFLVGLVGTVLGAGSLMMVLLRL